MANTPTVTLHLTETMQADMIAALQCTLVHLNQHGVMCDLARMGKDGTTQHAAIKHAKQRLSQLIALVEYAK